VKAQKLPHVHALLSQVYEDLGLIPEAIEQLKMALSIDLDGAPL